VFETRLCWWELGVSVEVRAFLGVISEGYVDLLTEFPNGRKWSFDVDNGLSCHLAAPKDIFPFLPFYQKKIFLEFYVGHFIYL